MGAYAPTMPTDNSQDSGILSFLDSLIKTAGSAYTISQGGATSTVQTTDKNIYQNTSSPNQTTLSLGGFTTAELLIMVVVALIGVYFIAKG